MNIKIILSYDGSEFKGFAPQPHKNTILDTLQGALSHFNIITHLNGSGRTDSGVHASYQVVSCVIEDVWDDLEKLKKLLNHTLPQSINIKSIKKVHEDFHARFSAKKRAYRYIITTKPISPFNNKYITYWDSINLSKLQNAIKLFKGVHNFSNFRKLGSDNKSDVREIFEAYIYQYDDFYIFYFEGNSFLRSQIRYMMGYLRELNLGKITHEDIENALSQNSTRNIKPIEPNGLYLAKVKY